VRKAEYTRVTGGAATIPPLFDAQISLGYDDVVPGKVELDLTGDIVKKF
jgi:hypothetical protein